MNDTKKIETGSGYICPIVEVEDGELAFELPDEILEALDLKIGDSLFWEPRIDGTFVLRKV